MSSAISVDAQDVAAVSAAREQDHVGPQLAQPADLLVGAAAIVQRDHVHDDRARTERGALRALARHLLAPVPRPSSAGRRRARRAQVEVDAVLAALRGQDRVAVEQLPAAQLLDLAHGVQTPRVTSSNGASTVVGASPRVTSR
jgi:hypothetical protein